MFSCCLKEQHPSITQPNTLSFSVFNQYRCNDSLGRMNSLMTESSQELTQVQNSSSEPSFLIGAPPDPNQIAPDSMSPLRMSQESMKVGYLMFKPHLKYFYLSKDEQQLCWKSPHLADEKSLPLLDIAVVMLGEKGAAMAKEETLMSERCVLIQTRGRTFELYALHQDIAEVFVKELNEVILHERRFDLVRRK